MVPPFFYCVIAGVEAVWKKTILTFGKPQRFIPENEIESRNPRSVNLTSILPSAMDLIGLGSMTGGRTSAGAGAFGVIV